MEFTKRDCVLLALLLAAAGGYTILFWITGGPESRKWDSITSSREAVPMEPTQDGNPPAQDWSVVKAADDYERNPALRMWDVVKAADNHDYVRFATWEGCGSPVHAAGCMHEDCVARRQQEGDSGP
jgi:hypothetical protein